MTDLRHTQPPFPQMTGSYNGGDQARIISGLLRQFPDMKAVIPEEDFPAMGAGWLINIGQDETGTFTIWLTKE